MEGDRIWLQTGTRVTLTDGTAYEITGAPVGRGGGSLIYPVRRWRKGGADAMPYALKECYPVSSQYPMVRDENGLIRPVDDDETAAGYLSRAKAMMIAEKEITQKIYSTGFRSLPVLNSSDQASLHMPDGRETEVANTYALMESLTDKGMTLEKWLDEHERLNPYQTFHVTEQLLLSLAEVHRQGYLHLDIQASNIYIKGALNEESDQVVLIDFGSARATIDGQTAEISDRVIFSTPAYMSPEMHDHNDGHLRLTAAADIFSVGCLILYMLTGTLAPAPYKDKERYLTAWQLRKINCPKHLLEEMQQVIAKALYNDPAMRYASVEEMLAQVRSLRRALSPKQADLSGITYDAFICYKHSPVDSLAAKKLQGALEHYKAAVTTGKGKKQIGRIFVDEGELASCADYGGQIEEALKHAGWLIVICSKETKTSRWVNDEIETFLRYHDRSRLLAVLTEGEPGEVYPAALRGDGCEVLAADLRDWAAGSQKGSLSKTAHHRPLPKTALMKLAAPLLDTTFETLYQRKKLYTMQRLALWSAGAAGLLIIFLTYALYTGNEIRKNYKAARENEARYLSDMALDALAEGDRDKARDLVMQVMPEKGETGPVVPEQLHALNQINYAYKEIGVSYVPMHATDLPEGDEGTFSEDGTRYYIWNRDNCMAIDPATGEILWKISCKDLKTAAGDLLPVYEHNSFQRIEEMRLCDQDTLALQMNRFYAIIDTKTGQIQMADQKSNKERFEQAKDLREDKGEIPAEAAFHAEVTDAARMKDDSTLVCLNSGIIQQITGNGDENSMVLMAAKITRKPSDFDYDPVHDRIAMVTENQVIFLENAKDERMTAVSLPTLKKAEDVVIKNITYAESSGTNYRLVTFRQGKGIETKALAVYETGAYDCIYSSEIAAGSIDNIQIRTQEGVPVLIYTETGMRNKNTTLHTVTLDENHNETMQDMANVTKVISTRNLSACFTVKNDRQLWRDDTMIDKAWLITKPQLTADERYLCYTASKDEETRLCIYDLETDTLKEVALPDGEHYLATCEVTLSQKGHTLCISDRVENIYLYDCEKGEITQTIPAEKDSHADFFRNDELLVIKDKKSVKTYNIKTNTILSDIAYASNIGSLITDETGSHFEVSEISGFYWDPDTDEGMHMGDTAIFTVDDDGQIYLYAETKYANISPWCDEICVANGDQMYYGEYYGWE